MLNEADRNALAFLETIDSIKVVDTSKQRLQNLSHEDDFNALSVELLIEVGSYICLAGNIMPSNTQGWSRDQAVLGGHLVRLYKLISALLDQVCQRRQEISFIIARVAFECIVNLRFLIKHSDNTTIFNSYVAYSLRQEKRLHERIHKNIAKRSGETLPVEARMLASIDRAVTASGMEIDKISTSKPKEWADKNLFQRAQDIGLADVYLGVYGGPSASVHGNWMDLLGMQLQHEKGSSDFAADYSWTYPRPQIADTTALLAIEAARDYFQLIGDGPLEIIDDKLDNLSDRIREAMEAHEAFLVRSGAT